MSQLRRDTLFVALTRPQMFAGVTYSYFVINAIVATELLLIFRSIWALPLARAAVNPVRVLIEGLHGIMPPLEELPWG